MSLWWITVDSLCVPWLQLLIWQIILGVLVHRACSEEVISGVTIKPLKNMRCTHAHLMQSFLLCNISKVIQREWDCSNVTSPVMSTVHAVWELMPPPPPSLPPHTHTEKDTHSQTFPFGRKFTAACLSSRIQSTGVRAPWVDNNNYKIMIVILINKRTHLKVMKKQTFLPLSTLGHPFPSKTKKFKYNKNVHLLLYLGHLEDFCPKRLTISICSKKVQH